MPCPWSRRCRAASANTGGSTTENGADAAPRGQDWKKVRKESLFVMRRQIRHVVLLLALTEAMRHGPIQLVYAGRHDYPAPGEDDFGIAYNAGYILSYLYVCLFMIVFVPLFSWWVEYTPADPERPSTVMKIAEALKSLNLILLPFTIALCLVQHAFYTARIFLYADGRKAESTWSSLNTRKAWSARLLMLLGIAVSTTSGYGAFQVLANMDLAHVKTLEYAAVVVPFQVNLGLVMASIVQWKIEKRAERRTACKLVKLEDGLLEEKAPLVEA